MPVAVGPPSDLGLAGTALVLLCKFGGAPTNTIVF